MKYMVLMIVGCMLSNCAVMQAVTGAPIQARDVISSINTVNNLNKYSEPAAREELEREVRAQLRRWETQ